MPVLKGGIAPTTSGQADWDSIAFYASTLMMSVSMDDSAATPPLAGIPQDELHKRYFANVVAVRGAIVDFVRRPLPNADKWIDRLDFDTLEPMPTETVDEAFRSRFNDMAWRLRFRDPGHDAEWLYVIVMLEFPSTVDWLMALRVQSYAVRIYESIPFVKSPNSETRLPPILAIVVYNGRWPWWAARRLSDLAGHATGRTVAFGSANLHGRELRADRLAGACR